jgi:acyl-CoA synthetase (NDP forming)
MAPAADRAAVERVLAAARATGRSSLGPEEARSVAEAYGIATPAQGLARSADEAVALAGRIGWPVVAKLVSPDILHKTEAGGVISGLASAAALRDAHRSILERARAHDSGARVDGVLVQQMLPPGQEVIVGATTDPGFGKLVAFGLGGVLVEVLRDVVFRLAPLEPAAALAMLDEVSGAAVLRGVRGARGVDREALARLVSRVSQLVDDFPEIRELDLNPVIAGPEGAVAVDLRVLLDFAPAPARVRPSQGEIVAAMRRIMAPRAVAVIGASAEAGKIGNSVMRNLIDGGYRGAIHPVHPRAQEILGRRCHRSVAEIPGEVDVAIFCIPAPQVAGVLAEVGRKRIAGAILIPSGFSEVGKPELQDEVLRVAREHGVRLMGPNIYGYYSTHHDLCATFCTPYTEKGRVALSSQSGGVGMAIIGFSRSNRLGVSAIVGLGNKADLDEDDLLAFFEQDPNTGVIAMHVEDLKDGRAFAEVARRVSRSKPVVVLKAGRTAQGARAARSHTAALAGDDRVYDCVLREAGVIRAHSLNDMLEYARGLATLPTPRGENVLILTGAGGSGVLLSDACADAGLRLMQMPPDLDEAFRKHIPPFGASGNPVDITGGEPPKTYRATLELALSDPRVHALILGYWHTIITPPMVFAELLAETVAAARQRGIHKPVVCSLVGDVEVEEACRYLGAREILAYPYTTEKPVAVLGAKYRWARTAGLI